MFQDKRVSFEVAQILKEYDPFAPEKHIAGSSGMLYLFDGENVLHSVSAAREGSREAAVFLSKEEPPVETEASKARAHFFYDGE